MSNFNTIIIEHRDNKYFAGKQKRPNNIEDKRKSLIAALTIRESECLLRYKRSICVLILILCFLVYLIIFKINGLDTYKEIMGGLGGGSLIGLLTYILSLRDEITKIRQTKTIADQVEGQILDTILLTIPVK